MNTQRKHEILNELDIIKRWREHLESYRKLQYITEEQYQAAGIKLQNRLAELEEECEINKPIFTSKGVLYEDEAEIFESEYQKQIIKKIEDIDDERRNS